MDETTADVHATDRMFMRYEIGSMPDLEERVRSGEFVIGRFQYFSSASVNLAFVKSTLLPHDVVVNMRENMKRVLHNDIVAVKLLPRKVWQHVEQTKGKNVNRKNDPRKTFRGNPHTRPSSPGYLVDGTHAEETRPEVILANQMSAPQVYKWGSYRPIGRVVCVLARECPSFVVAKFVESSLISDEPITPTRYYKFKVFNPMLPHVAVKGEDIMAHDSSLLMTNFFLLRFVTTGNGDVEWMSDYFPLCSIVAVLDSTKSIQANSLAICAAWSVNTKDFSEEAHACVPETFKIPDKQTLEQMGRRDLREEEFVCTIDPETARDFDDALSITATESGYRVGVHIADVTYFVPVKSALDDEARSRMTSVYLVEKVIPMLPPKLSEDYCSLNTKGDKFTVSAIFQFDHNGQLKDEWFGRTVIRNRCRLAYEQAQRIIDGDEAVLDALDYGECAHGEAFEDLKAKVKVSIITLLELATKLREHGLSRGRITIEDQTPSFQFENISNPTHAVGLTVRGRAPANWLVEEFMLLANTRVAEKIIEYLPEQALMRGHEPPSNRKVAHLRKSVERAGVNLPEGPGRIFQSIVEQSKSHPLNVAICAAVKYSMKQTTYFVRAVSGEPDVPNGHYALAIRHYTHFTSPIRRYCDIVVHRQLLCALEMESIVKQMKGSGTKCYPGCIAVGQLKTRDLFYTVSDVAAIADSANTKKSNAQYASEASISVHFCHYFNSVKQVWETKYEEKAFDPHVKGVVVLIADTHFVVWIPCLALETIVRLNSKRQKFKLKLSEEASDAPKSAEGVADGTGEVAPQQNTGESGGTQMQNRTRNRFRNVARERNEENKVCLFWENDPATGGEVREEITLLSEVTASVCTKNEKGYEEIDLIVDPPWARCVEVGSLPLTLEW
ncbi:RNB domain [Trypanosoma vivax]|nr:ribonuclease II-like protein [Trypanosoma vivax]KAH8609539.1 RNB domain [Trypanosoma vivax]